MSNEVEKYLEEMGKGQHTRLFDMFALGPFMMWYANKSKSMGKWPRRALFISGAMTIVYNWNNYKNIKTILTDKYKKLEEVSAKVTTGITGKNFLS